MFWISGSLHTAVNFPQGSTPSPMLNVSLANSNVPMLGGVGFKGDPPNLVPSGQNPPTSFRNSNNFWGFSTFFKFVEESSTSEYEIVDRALCHVYTARGIITFHEDPLFGVRCPFILNNNMPPFAGDPPGDVGPSLADALANEVAVAVFGINTIGSPYQVEILESHFDTVNSVHREEDYVFNMFLNIDRVKKILPPGSTAVTLEFNVNAYSGAEGVTSWGIGVAELNPINKIKEFSIDPTNGNTVPLDENGDQVPVLPLGTGNSDGVSRSVVYSINLETYAITVEVTPP